MNITQKDTLNTPLTRTHTSREKEIRYSYHAFVCCAHYVLALFHDHNSFHTLSKSFSSGYVLKNIFLVLETSFWLMDSYFDLSFPYEKRSKLDYKTEKCIYLGMSPRHSADTHRLLSLTTNQVIYRRNVSFNERSFPARATAIMRPTKPQKDTGEDLIGQTFTDDNETFVITQCSRYDGVDCLDYISTRTKEETYSTIPEVRKWIRQPKILQMANNIQPSRKGYMNTLAETM
jgi:hypothetical protein